MIERYRGPRRVRLHGERLAKLRCDLGLSLAAVAERCGVTRQAVMQWEQERTLPDDRVIGLLVEWLGDRLVGVLDVKVYE